MRENSNRIKTFQRKVLAYYDQSQRSFPWRVTTNPYHILVSEFMLQQTQTARVVEKYESFIQTFPTLIALAKASFQDVLSYWHGLGYNRRARYLQETARIIMEQYNGIVPKDPDELQKLPGIGPYTASAISTFSYDIPNVFIETNIRSAFIHEFFPKKENVTDKEVLEIAEKSLLKDIPRIWYYALMDYGAMIKQTYGNPNHRSSTYTKQSPFEGSLRQKRGAIIKLLLAGKMDKNSIINSVTYPKDSVIKALSSLEQDNMVAKDANGDYMIAP